jgi:hypothetical protein
MTTKWTRLAAAMLISSFAVLAGSARAQPVEREGVKFEPVAQVGGAALQLNGAGVRTRMIIKVYAAGLYVPARSSDPKVLLAQKGPRRMALTMLRSVDAGSFAGALTEGLKNNHTEAQLAALQPQIDAFSAAFKAVGEAKKGDLVLIEFTPDAGTRVVVNGQQKGAVIPGEEFYTALLRIWLGDKPADADLKKGLLGA